MRCTNGGGWVSGPGGLATWRGCLGDNQLTDAELEAELCCRRAICPPAALNIINVSYNRTIASCDSVDVVLRCPKTLGPVGLVGASEVRFLLAPRASGFKCLMWRAGERPKFGHANETRSGHNFVGDRCKHGHKSASILQVFLHRLSENTKTAIAFCAV